MGKGTVTIVIAVIPTVIVAWFDFWLVVDPIHLVLPKFPYSAVLGKPHFETYNNIILLVTYLIYIIISIIDILIKCSISMFLYYLPYR